MEKKCEKFESLFISSDEAELLEHIKICPDCKAEYEKMEKVSSLIKEAAPLIKNRVLKWRPSFKIMAAVASFFVCALAFLTIQIINPSSFVNETIAYLSPEYSYEQMGLPVDDMGFIMVDFDY